MRDLLSIILVNALIVLANLASPLSARAAATFTIINLDSAGEGFNDPTPVAPVGGNAGTTLGQQRLNAFQHAANIWGNLIESPVVIRIQARFDPLFCNANSAVLGQAGPITSHRNFAGAPVPNTWYVQALANSLFGGDLAPGSNDIQAQFNSAVGTTCPFPNVWYYGLDGNAPANRIDFVTVLLHELGHGLGFLTFVDLGTGAKLLNSNDAYMRFLENHATGELYPEMTNAERVAASKSTGNLHWTGPNVVAGGGGLTAGRHASGHVQMYAPNPQQPGSSVSHYDTALFPDEMMEPFYTGPSHDVGLTLELFADLGWDVSGIPIIDQTAPGKIADLKAGTPTQTSIALNWTAPGDNDDTGTAANYDIRMSTTKITDANWDLATPLNGEPAPSPAGSAQNFTATGLLCNRNYFFAAKTADEANNVSPLSNIARAKTTACNKVIPSPKTLPVGEAGVSYTKTVDLLNGAGPYDVQFDPTTVPPWLATNALVASSKPVAPKFLANSSFTLTGTPPLTEAGKTFNIAAVITDAVGSVLKAKFKLKVAKPVEITTTALKPGKVNKDYSATPRAKFGVKAYSWTAKLNSALPSGSTFAFDPVKGKISVFATDTGSVDVTFQVTDAAGGTDTQVLTLTFN
jgi:hypothetical protein